MAYQDDRITAIPAPLPKDYDRGFSFTDYQTLNPGDPMPGPKLDTEFANIEQALDETQARLRLIQQDDGSFREDFLVPYIVDSLVSTDAEKALSANQGRVLNNKIGLLETDTGSAAKNKVTSLFDVTSLSTLDTDALVAGQGFSVHETVPGSGTGGGGFEWSSTTAKSEHDGIYTISPTVPPPTDFTNAAQVTDYKNGVGETDPSGNGVFIRRSVDVDSKFDPYSDVRNLATSLSQYMSYGGTADAIELTTGNGVVCDSLQTGMQFRFRATATNTGATTIAVDGGSPVDCVTVTGVALPAGYIRTDVDTVGTFDGTDFVVDRQIERGSNSNGEFVRFSNGRQECRAKITLLYGDAGWLRESWTFPASFVGADPYVKAGLVRFTSGATPTASRIGPPGPDRGGNLSLNDVDIELHRISGMTDFEPGDTAEAFVWSDGEWY